MIREFSSDQASHPSSPVWAVTVTGCLCVYVQYKQTCVGIIHRWGAVLPQQRVHFLHPTSVFAQGHQSGWNHAVFLWGPHQHLFMPGRHWSGLNHAVYLWGSLVFSRSACTTQTLLILDKKLYHFYIDIVPIWLKKKGLSKKQFVHLQKIVLFHHPVTKFQLFQVSRCLAAVWRRILDSSIHAY